MTNFIVGLMLGLLIAGIGVAGAQFYPGMPPNVRDAGNEPNDATTRNDADATRADV
jgi:hypothetical protein